MKKLLFITILSAIVSCKKQEFPQPIKFPPINHYKVLVVISDTTSTCVSFQHFNIGDTTYMTTETQSNLQVVILGQFDSTK